VQSTAALTTRFFVVDRSCTVHELGGCVTTHPSQESGHTVQGYSASWLLRRRGTIGYNYVFWGEMSGPNELFFVPIYLLRIFICGTLSRREIVPFFFIADKARPKKIALGLGFSSAPPPKKGHYSVCSVVYLAVSCPLDFYTGLVTKKVKPDIYSGHLHRPSEFLTIFVPKFFFFVIFRLDPYRKKAVRVEARAWLWKNQ
jgi:hypothetical protein